MKSDFIEYLKRFKFDEDDIHVGVDKDGQLEIIISGYVVNTIGFEVPVLAIVSEVYSGHMIQYAKPDRIVGKCKAMKQRLQIPNDFKFAEFGTRRRFSREHHEYVIHCLKGYLGEHFVGTSNVLLAKKYNLTPIGTMAHEWIMTGQELSLSLRDSQKYMLQKWVDEYRGDLGIAISDTLGIDAFLNDFDMYFAKLFDGVRLDSGNPKVSGDKMIAHYQKLGIDPKSKWLIPSDSLTFPEALRLYLYFRDRINISFGIGTYLTNDVGLPNLNIVIKPIEFNGCPVAKISDSPGKMMCEQPYHVDILKKMFNIGGDNV
jgi:nicotinate phosphoribosyltransferase